MKRFVYNINKVAGDPTTTSNEVVSFDDYSHLKAVSWIGENGGSLDLELKTHDGKSSIVESVPLEYYKIGSGREEMILEQPISNNSIRIATSFTTGTAIKGALVFTLEKE
ncbi:hypothetical protein QUH73_04330 [Labilibaculum sp. K2S]|uniref:hypothetical protein n=1 Tax=Labilibaculum sp. K2S TaxID=3056386 RepID=UPI0025A334B2|nr:hypothetical protein [Labilibaculum sp. K2S]MDM8159042.1 hypothetical protein [Labilibaculum sp. K2S]